MDRREITNQHGVKVPTETQAIWTIDKKEKALATARKLYGIFIRNCNLVGFTLT